MVMTCIIIIFLSTIVMILNDCERLCHLFVIDFCLRSPAPTPIPTPRSCC